MAGVGVRQHHQAAIQHQAIAAEDDVARLIAASDNEVVTTGITATACVVTIPATAEEVGTAGSFTMFDAKTPAIAA